MEELELQENPGLFGKLRAKLHLKEHAVEDDFEGDHRDVFKPRYVQESRYQVVVRRQIVSFQDAISAADGLKRGEQQILNLNAAENSLREKIKDFMCGVNYAEDGTWEELGDNIYLLAPPEAQVEVAPPSPRMAAQRN